MLGDIIPGEDGFGDEPPGFIAYAGQVYFSARDGAHGIELWRSSFTANGATLVHDLRAGTEDSLDPPLRAVVIDDQLVFVANRLAYGDELHFLEMPLPQAAP